MSVESRYAALSEENGAFSQHVMQSIKSLGLGTMSVESVDMINRKVELHIKRVHLKIRGCISTHDIQKKVPNVPMHCFNMML